MKAKMAQNERKMKEKKCHFKKEMDVSYGGLEACPGAWKSFTLV
jgi:hypothetical protein